MRPFISVNPMEFPAKKPRVMVLSNVRTSTSWSMRNSAHNIAISIAGSATATVLEPLAPISARVSGRFRKYAIYFDVYVLTAIYLSIAQFGHDLIVAADHTYAPALWAVPRRKRTTFVHDTTGIRHALGMLEAPSLPGLLGRLYQRAVLGSIRAMPIVGVNTGVGAEELRQLGSKAEVCVVGQTVAPQRLAGARSTNAGGSPYILHIGSDTWVKNKAYLLKLYREFRDFYGGRAPDLWLVGETLAPTRDLIQELGLSDFVHLEESVADERLAEILNACLGLVMPSRYEGFGLPPLEALRSGKQIFISDIPVFREVYGAAATYLDLKNPKRAAEQLTSALRQPQLNQQAAAEILSRYSFEQCALRTSEWIMAAVARARPPRRGAKAPEAQANRACRQEARGPTPERI